MSTTACCCGDRCTLPWLLSLPFTAVIGVVRLLLLLFIGESAILRFCARDQGDVGEAGAHLGGVFGAPRARLTLCWNSRSISGCALLTRTETFLVKSRKVIFPDDNQIPAGQ